MKRNKLNKPQLQSYTDAPQSASPPPPSNPPPQMDLNAILTNIAQAVQRVAENQDQTNQRLEQLDNRMVTLESTQQVLTLSAQGVGGLGPLGVGHGGMTTQDPSTLEAAGKHNMNVTMSKMVQVADGELIPEDRTGHVIVLQTPDGKSRGLMEALARGEYGGFLQ